MSRAKIAPGREVSYIPLASEGDVSQRWPAKITAVDRDGISLLIDDPSGRLRIKSNVPQGSRPGTFSFGPPTAFQQAFADRDIDGSGGGGGNASDITNDSGVAGANVAAALDTLDTAISGVTDVRGPIAVIGNSVDGDGAGTVTHLDSGNGDAMRSALATLGAGGGGEAVLRRGDFNLIAGDGTTNTVIPANVTLRGHGDESRLLFPLSGQMLALQINGGKLLNVQALQLLDPSDTLTDGAGNRFVEVNGDGVLENCLMSIRANSIAAAGRFPGFYSLFRVTGSGSVRNSRFTGYSSVALGGGNECLLGQSVGGFGRIVNCVFGSPSSTDLLDVAAEIGEAGFNTVEGCSINHSRAVGVRLVSVFGLFGALLRGNIITADSGVAIADLFVGNGSFIGASIVSNMIECASGVPGIRLTPTDALRDYIAAKVSDNVLRSLGGTATGIEMQPTGTGTFTGSLASNNVLRGFSTGLDLGTGVTSDNNISS